MLIETTAVSVSMQWEEDWLLAPVVNVSMMVLYHLTTWLWRATPLTVTH